VLFLNVAEDSEEMLT